MFRFIPNVLLKQLYTRNSLRNTPEGFTFSLKNRLSDARFIGLQRARIDNHDYPADAFTLETDGGEVVAVNDISAQNPLVFSLRWSVQIRAKAEHLAPGKHTLEITLHTQPFGAITILIEDELRAEEPERADTTPAIPRDSVNDYSSEAIGKRRTFLRDFTKTNPQHIIQNSFDPAAVQGHCENFIGVAQVPIGLAGPLHITVNTHKVIS